MRLLYVILVLLILISSSIFASDSESRFNINVEVVKAPLENSGTGSGGFIISEGEFGRIIFTFYNTPSRFHVKAVGASQSDIQHLTNLEANYSDSIMMLIDLLMTAGMDQNGDIRLFGTLNKFLYTDDQSDEKSFKFSTKALDFIIKRDKSEYVSVKSSIPDKDAIFKISSERYRDPSTIKEDDYIRYEAQYSLYNVTDSRYEIKGEKCKLSFLPGSADKKKVCRHGRKFNLDNGDTLLYWAVYEIEDAIINNDESITFTFFISRHYVINPSAYYDKAKNEWTTTFSDKNINDNPDNYTGKLMGQASFAKAVTVLPGEKTEIEIPVDVDAKLPFKAIEVIALYNPEEFVPVDVMPDMISSEVPAYPLEAKKSGVEGYVFIKALVDKNGDIAKAYTTECDKPGYGFEESAVEAAYKNKFNPALQGNKPVAIWITYKVEFSLEDK